MLLSTEHWRVLLPSRGHPGQQMTSVYIKVIDVKTGAAQTASRDAAVAVDVKQLGENL